MLLSRTQVLLLAVCTGLIVANIYYCQPLVVLIAREFNIAESVAGKINYFTQAGYAVGLLFIVPLGDKIERKKQILYCTLSAIVALMAAAFSPTFAILCIAGFFIGFTSVIPQLILPLAAGLSTDEKRGAVIGTIMSGLLIGILLSRTLSGFVGALFGWRTMYEIAAVICLIMIFVLFKVLPLSKPTYSGSYKQLMLSMVDLVKTQPVLRQAALINALTFATFSAFWTVMVLLLANKPFSFSSNQIGLFGLAGAAGAFAAPLVGKLSGKNPIRNIRLGMFLQIFSFALALLVKEHLAYFIAAIIIIDIGQQAIHVTNQTRIYALVPQSRNRLNTIFMSVSFIGAASGSALGLLLWDLGGWVITCIGSLVLILINLCISYYKR